MARLLLARHGETEMGRARQLCGSSDEPLNPQGLYQAEQLRDYLAGQRLDAIYSSDLKRAWATAAAVAQAPPPEVVPCLEMREMDFGLCEGLTFAQIEQLHPQVTRLWLARSPRLAYPGGESLDQFEQRVASFNQRLEKHGMEDTILLIAHLGSLRLLLCRQLGIPREHWWQFQLDYASVSTVLTHPPRSIPESGPTAMLLRLNETCHLEKAGPSLRQAQDTVSP